MALEGLGRPICTPSVLSEKHDILFACPRATMRHRTRSGGPLGGRVPDRGHHSEAWANEWALKSPSTARTDRYTVEDGCGGVGGRLRMGTCPDSCLRVQICTAESRIPWLPGSSTVPVVSGRLKVEFSHFWLRGW